MFRTGLAAFVLIVALSVRAEAQASTGPRLTSFYSLPGLATRVRHQPTALLGPQRVPAAHRGRLVLVYTGLGVAIGAATGALVGPVMTNSACLSWKKDPGNLGTCLDAFFTAREHLRSAVILAGVGTVVGAVTGLIAHTGP